MSDPRIPLKQPLLAGLLAFLVPGAGHFYQGRYFKAVIYFAGITGLFLAGMRMSDGKAMYLNRSSPEHDTSGRHTLLRFAAQFGVGGPALWALVQRERFYSAGNEWDADHAETFEFSGTVRMYEDNSEYAVTGRVELEPYVDDFGSRRVGGRFRGVDQAGDELQLLLSGDDQSLGNPVGASAERSFRCRILAADGSSGHAIGVLDGSVPRPFWNWYASPMRVEEERQMHRRLGKFHELAMVFTWVAGLLNLLAIWDAVEGPAYGYGDEPDRKETGEAADAAESDAADDERAAESEAASASPEPART